MKKMFAVFLSMVLCFGLVGCGASETAQAKQPSGFMDFKWGTTVEDLKAYESEDFIFINDDGNSNLKYGIINSEDALFNFSLLSQDIVYTTFSFEDNKLVSIKSEFQSKIIPDSVFEKEIKLISDTLGEPTETGTREKDGYKICSYALFENECTNASMFLFHGQSPHVTISYEKK